jgi:hypothetical protein
MSFEYSLHPEENLIRIRCTGDFTIEGLIGWMEEMGTDPLITPGMNLFGDYREARWVGDVQEMGDYIDYNEKVQGERGAFKSAVVVGGEGEMELVRMFNMVSHQRGLGIETKGFLVEEEAMVWLGGDA